MKLHGGREFQVKNIILEKNNNTNRFDVIINDDSKYGISWEDNEFGITSKAIPLIHQIMKKWGRKKISIANEYAKNDRQIIVFLNEIVALSQYLTNNDKWFSLAKIANADELMHNRVVAQFLYEYDKLGLVVSIHDLKRDDEKKFDLHLDRFECEVKTILPLKGMISGSTGSKLTESDYLWLKHKLEEKYDEAKQQVGENGILIISVWSYYINALLRNRFKSILSTTPPDLEEGVVILVIYGEFPMQYYYLKLRMDDFKTSVERLLSEIQKGVKASFIMQSMPITLTTAPEKGASATIVFG